MRRTLAGVLFGLLFALSPAYPQTITASAQTTIVVNTTPVTGGSNGQCLTISSGTVGSGACGSGGGLTVGTSTITSGTTTRILYDNAGVLGEYTLTGTGTVAAMQTSPTLITPVLGVATATSVAIGGCTIGTDVLCTTGTTTLNGKTTVTGGSFGLSGNISAAAWTTAGIRYANVVATMTDTTSSGTVAAAYTDVFGGNAVAASNATTFTNYYGAYIKVPTAGTNVTLTKSWALGADSIAVNGAGSAAAPSLALNNFENSTGWYVTGAGKVALSVGGTLRYDYGVSTSAQHTFVSSVNFQNFIFVTSSVRFTTGAGQIQLQNDNTIISSPAAAKLQFGDADAAAPVAQITQVQNVVAGTSNTAGVNWTLKASAGTGTGAGGDMLFQVAAAGTTGTSQNAFATAFSVRNTGVIQNNIVFSAAGTPLPTCNGAAEGSRGAVSDALTPTFLTAYVSGGTTHASVYCDGTSWKTD
jgi:hypothetical protein